MATATNPGTEAVRTPHALMLIGGKAVESSDGRYIEIENPSNRSVIAQVPRATDIDVDTAVRAAAAAFEQWKVVAPRGRGRLLLNRSPARSRSRPAMPSGRRLVRK